ncbi:hypothetical protein BKA61DRAFT_736347 [Leptodontidium sp. MPI-SDFR-AT-0119]|nr:hypothetical protein BKA61DRAFT_736347 [Leptodontidium sp. MPI-SDFR-AT-0119]
MWVSFILSSTIIHNSNSSTTEQKNTFIATLNPLHILSPTLPRLTTIYKAIQISSIMQFSTITILLATLTISTQVFAAPTPYIKKVDTPSGRPKYVCVDSDLSCLTKRAFEAITSVPGVGGFIGHVISSTTGEIDRVVKG